MEPSCSFYAFFVIYLPCAIGLYFLRSVLKASATVEIGGLLKSGNPGEKRRGTPVGCIYVCVTLAFFCGGSATDPVSSLLQSFIVVPTADLLV